MISHPRTVDGRGFCRVCGDGVPPERDALDYALRCERHVGRNCCAIEGCKRSCPARPLARGFDGFNYQVGSYLCGEHWRRYCPPRSARRRQFHRLRKAAERVDWRCGHERSRFLDFWDAMVRSARARHAAGALDMAAVNKLMGW